MYLFITRFAQIPRQNVDHLGEDISQIKVPIFPSRLSIGVGRGLRSTSPVLPVLIDEFIKNLIVLEECHILMNTIVSPGKYSG